MGDERPVVEYPGGHDPLGKLNRLVPDHRVNAVLEFALRNPLRLSATLFAMGRRRRTAKGVPPEAHGFVHVRPVDLKPRQVVA